LSRQQNPDFTSFQDQFTGMGFDVSDLDDGWGINAHDALATAVAAINSIPLLSDGAARNVTPGQVNIEIGAFSRGDHPVPTAVQGPLLFGNDGNRAGDAAPRVAQICPPHGEPLRTFTVDAYPGRDTCPPA
jgi:hypothetical protein